MGLLCIRFLNTMALKLTIRITGRGDIAGIKLERGRG